MGNDLFKSLGINLAKIIHAQVSPLALPATLTKITPGTRTAGSLSAGTNPTETDYPCRGFIDSTRRENVEGGLEANGLLRVVLIGDSIDGGAVAPELGDQITIEGTTYLIPDDGRIERDPAAATYACQVRPL